MDLNNVTLSGRVFDMRFNPTYNPTDVGVAEGKISVMVGRRKDEDVFEEFNIRAYGKKSEDISLIQDGTFVTLSGRLREDIRVNSSDPNTTRSKVYVNIDCIKYPAHKGQRVNE